MKKFTLFHLIILISAASYHTYSQDESKGNIEVQVNGVEVEQGGELLVLLYDSEETWLEAEQAFKIISVSSLKDTMRIVFEALSFSSAYAVQIIHDKNGNKELDMRTLPYPKPKEGFGVSNNTYRMGPPEYEKAQLKLNKEVVEVIIDLRY